MLVVIGVRTILVKYHSWIIEKDLFIGPWTRAETTFSNEYFRLLLEEPWILKTTHEGKPWKGPPQFESKDGALMMLPSDMALVQDPKFKQYVELYAKDEDAFFRDFSYAFSKLLELGVAF
jgi:cytochrome c peroxidase